MIRSRKAGSSSGEKVVFPGSREELKIGMRLAIAGAYTRQHLKRIAYGIDKTGKLDYDTAHKTYNSY